MNFAKPDLVWATIENLIDADEHRAINRTRINRVFNGETPYTSKEAEENRINTNVNFLEGTQILQRARSQFENAFLSPENFFTVTLDVGPKGKRQSWGRIITKAINKRMKRSPRYFHARESQDAAVVLHGVGPVVWFRDRDWCPMAKGTEDVLVPSGTLTDLENMDYFAVHQTFTPGQLMRMTQGKPVDKGWKTSVVNQALSRMVKFHEGGQSNYADSLQFPEKAEEELKMNGGYWASDAVPVLHCWDFYYRDWEKETDKTPWRRKIVIDQSDDVLGMGKLKDGGILYENPDINYGDDVSQLMHTLFADGSVVPPFRWHSVRSLGYQLYAVCHLQNRLRCKFNDAVFESMMWYFRNSAAGDEESLQKIDLMHLGIIPDGLRWVLPNERHQVDDNLVGALLSQNRQLLQEQSASYVRDVDMAPGREPETATGIMARVNASNQAIGAMLNRAIVYLTYQYQEIARRFCVLNHEDCKKAREDCQREGVDPEVFKKYDTWNVIPERPLGAGNAMLQIAQADRLMQIRPVLDPASQRWVTHLYVEANTNDARLASELVPMEGAEPSKGVQMATLAWGTLIDGKPVVVAEGIERTDYIETLLKLLMGDIQQINQSGGIAPAKRIEGLANVINHLEEQVEIVAEDQAQGERVKVYKDMLGRAANEVKAYAQRLQEAMEKQAQEQQGPDPETMVKIQSEMAMTQANLAAMEAERSQKLRLDQIQFAAEQQRKDQAFAAEQRRRMMATTGDQARANASTAADINRDNLELAASIQQEQIETKARIENQKKLAEQKPTPETPAK